jgi:hypothetical protein
MMRYAARSRPAGSLWASPRAARLHHHHADRVRDEVVQLAGDPPALVGDRDPPVLLAGLFELRGGLVQAAREQRPRAHRAPG